MTPVLVMADRHLSPSGQCIFVNSKLESFNNDITATTYADCKIEGQKIFCEGA
jgi:hypothetical protein